MRALILGLAATVFAGAANANPYETLNYRSTDYSAFAYYQLSFGQGASGFNQKLGFRFASDAALQAGAPAMFRMEYMPGYNSFSTVAVNGLNVSSIPYALGLTPEQQTVGLWVAGGVGAAFLTAVIVSDDNDSGNRGGNNGGTGGTGGSGGG